MFHVKQKTALLLLAVVMLVSMLVPTPSLAVDATDGTSYSEQLLNDGGNKQQHDYDIGHTQEWVNDTVQNKDTTGYESEGTSQQFLANFRTALTGIFQASLGVIMLLFGAKMAGRGIFTLVYKDDQELFDNLPQFFMTGNERSAMKQPSVLTSSFGRAMGAGRGGGKGKGPKERDYTGADHIEPHPYVSFMKEFVIAFFVAFAVWVGIEIALGIIIQIFNMNDGYMVQPRQIFGNLSERL